MTAKDDLRTFVDSIPEAEADLWLQAIQNRDIVLLHALLAPLDDEPETEEERAAVAESWAAYDRGDVLSHEEVMRQLGL